MTTPSEFTPTRQTSPGSEVGFVPRLDVDPSTAPYEALTPDVAVDRIAAVGFDRADAEYMVANYLREHTARYGEPAGGWRIDTYDLADIAVRWEWVDHYRGETIAEARARVAEYAAGYRRLAARIDRDQDPHHAAMLDREAAVWAELARDGDDPGPVAENIDTGGEELAAAAERGEAAVAVTDPPGAEPVRGDTDYTAGFTRGAREDIAAELSALTTRLRALSADGDDARHERATVLADHQALLDRITDADTRLSARDRISARAALAEVALARAADHGYVLVGPSARTWIRDPATGQPTREASNAEHQAVRDLLGSNELDATTPQWVTAPDGRTDLHATVIPTDSSTDDDLDVGDLDTGDLDEESRPQGWWARANSPVEPTVTFDASGYYTDAQIAAIAAALNDAGDDEGEEAGRREQLTRWHHNDHLTDDQVAHEQGATDHTDGYDGAGWDR